MCVNTTDYKRKKNREKCIYKYTYMYIDSYLYNVLKRYYGGQGNLDMKFQ